MQKKKVLFLCRLYAPHVGGVERHVQFLSRELQQKGYSICVLTEIYDPILPRTEIIENIDVRRIDRPNVKYLGLVSIWWQLLRQWRWIEQHDIIHCHDVFIWYLPLRLLFPNKKVFVTYHGYESYPVRQTAIFIRHIAEQMSNGGICVGEFMKKWYRQKTKLVTYGAVDLEKFNAHGGKIKYDAIFSSRLDEQTGILTYSKVVDLLPKQFKFVILGDGQYLSEAKRVGKVLGFVEHPAQLLSQSKYAFASRYLAILEAFACKKLVFAVYDNPLKEDYLRMTPFASWIVIESDPQKLAEKVLYYERHPEKAKPLIEAAYTWVQHQTWEAMAMLYIHLWEQSL